MNAEIVRHSIEACGITDFSKASIREFVRLVALIEAETRQRFVRMEMGVPGLPPAQVGVEAEIEALQRGVAAVYPPIDGIPELKKESSSFIQNFMNIGVSPSHCIPTVGSMQACYATMMVACRRNVRQDTLLFLDPGFPVQKQQMQVMGLAYESFDVYDYRGERLREKLISYLESGSISTILYSNPNNPSWVCLTENELRIIGELASQYGVVVVEDLAYFGMDFRQDVSLPGKAPYQATVARYTEQYVLLISSSKAFSYAGQRIAVLAVSDCLAQKKFPDLQRYFASDVFVHAIVYGALYALSAGTAHSAQYALTAMLKAANAGNFCFVKEVQEYGVRAAEMKQLFVDNGFHLVYDKDEDKPLADGFYFTVAYPGFSGSALVESLLYYGISAIPLETTGSSRSEGIRACVSFVNRKQLPDLKYRLEQFHAHHAV